MRVSTPWLLTFAVALSALAACQQECDRDACHAAATKGLRPAIGQGVGGVIAYATDACSETASGEVCCPCEFFSTEIEVWKSERPIVSAEAAGKLVGQSKAFTRFFAERRYARKLDVDNYLACVREVCAALRIDSGTVFTMNVQLTFGGPRLIVFGPDDREARSDLVFILPQVESSVPHFEDDGGRGDDAGDSDGAR